MKTKEWIAVIAVVVIVAVIASLITSNLTGNIIAVARGTAAKVYTVAEIDTKLKSLDNKINKVSDKLSKHLDEYLPSTNKKLLPITFKTDQSDSYKQKSKDSNGAIITYKNLPYENGEIIIEYNGDSVIFNTDNNQFAYVTFTSARAGTKGEKKLTWVYDNDTSSMGVQPLLAHQTVPTSNKGIIHVLEGETALINDWIVINQGDAGTILSVDDISIDTGIRGTVTFSEVITGDSQQITLTNSSGQYTKTGVNFFGGYGYTISVPNAGTSVNISWSLTGKVISPKIKLKNGNWIALGSVSNFKTAYNLETSLSDNTIATLFIENTERNDYILIPIRSINSEIGIGQPLATATTTGI